MKGNSMNKKWIFLILALVLIFIGNNLPVYGLNKMKTPVCKNVKRRAVNTVKPYLPENAAVHAIKALTVSVCSVMRGSCSGSTMCLKTMRITGHI